MWQFPLMAVAIDNDVDRAYMEQLYVSYGRLMMKCALEILGNAQDASDAVSQTMVSLIHHMDKLRQVDCEKLRAYIITTVRNVSINAAVKRNRESVYTFSAEEAVLKRIPSGEPLVEELVIGRFRKELLVWAIHQLSANDRAIIDMKYLSGATDQQIGKMLSLSPSSVRVYLTRARRRLYDIMKGRMFHEEQERIRAFYNGTSIRGLGTDAAAHCPAGGARGRHGGAGEDAQAEDD